MLKRSLFHSVLTVSLLLPTVLGSSYEINASANNTTQSAKMITQPKTNSNNNISSNSVGLTENQIQKIDPYVTVSNNQYQLNNQASSELNKRELQQATYSINQANKNVTQLHLTIDSATKRAMPSLESSAAWDSHYTTGNFWWGTRYYFTSNAAVAQMTSELQAYTELADIAGVIGKLFLSPAPQMVAMGAGIYFTSMSAYLNNYNNSHQNNQIYMDVNWVADYSCHILA